MALSTLVLLYIIARKILVQRAMSYNTKIDSPKYYIQTKTLCYNKNHSRHKEYYNNRHN